MFRRPVLFALGLAALVAACSYEPPDNPGDACAIFEERREKTMFIMGAASLRYGEIITVIDAAKGAGVEKVGIVTEGMRRASGGT